MLARTLGMLTTIFVYLAAATFVAQIIVLWHLWNAWGMDQQRLTQITAIAMGIDPLNTDRLREEIAQETSKEVLIGQVIERRALALRDIEAREQALKIGFDTLKLEQRRLEEAQTRYETALGNFQERMKQLHEGHEKEGLDETIAILQSVRAAQAKNQILIMLEEGKQDTVVMMLKNMDERPRAKIIAELVTEPENQQLAEVLWKIRQGEPEASLAQAALRELDAEPTGGPGN